MLIPFRSPIKRKLLRGRGEGGGTKEKENFRSFTIMRCRGRPKGGGREGGGFLFRTYDALGECLGSIGEGKKKKDVQVFILTITISKIMARVKSSERKGGKKKGRRASSIVLLPLNYQPAEKVTREEEKKKGGEKGKFERSSALDPSKKKWIGDSE